MFWTEEKLNARIQELSPYRYRERIPFSSFHFTEEEKCEVKERPPKVLSPSYIKVGDLWSGRDVYAWLSADIAIPKAWKNKKIVGRFDFGKTGNNNIAGFESLCYLDGIPFQGVDSNHQEVFIPSNKSGEKIRLDFRLWSGLEGLQNMELEHRINMAEISFLDEEVDDLFFTAKAILESIDVLPESQPERVTLLSILNRSFLKIDWSNPGSAGFYTTIKEANNSLVHDLKKIEKNHPVTIKAIGHTHIDVAWLWRLKHTREKSARSFSTVLRLMEQYPEYSFLQTQPQLYDYLKTDYPDIYRKIQEKVYEGRWEIDGGMWLEADCNIPSGESLVRQLLMGTRFIKDEFEKECKYLWLPDVFGYSWALPQILRKSGINTFMTTKISWNQYNRLPHDTFQWRGIDGTEILTHFISTPDQDRDQYTYNGEITAKSITGIWDLYQDKAVNQELLLCYGYGDGGGGVNREMLEMRRRFDQLPGLPNVETGRADDYFKQLHTTIHESDQYIHTWDGELYLEYHRGTYTSQAKNKRMNRRLELLYRDIEWLASVSSILSNDYNLYPKNELDNGWKIILRNQFHDIIPGSSIKEVYQDSLQEYKTALNLYKDAFKSVTEELINDKDPHSFTVINSAPWKREDVIEINQKSDGSYGVWRTSKGQELTSQKTEKGWLLSLTAIPSMGFETVEFFPSNQKNEIQASFRSLDQGIETPYYQIKWDDNGHLIQLFDLEEERHVICEEQKSNIFQVFEDKPMNYDAWDIDLYYTEKMKEVTQLQSIEYKESGPLRAIIQFKWKYNNSVISQDMVLSSKTKRIDFKTNVEWNEKQELLKVAFPVNIRSTEATYDIQFGNVKRPTHWNTSWDMARFETVGHQWADLSETGYGVSLLNDCKYGYDIKDNVMRLSLIKSAISPDPDQDQGDHQFTYSLYPHAGNWIEGNVQEEAWQINSPLNYIQGKTDTTTFSSFHINASNVMIDTVKKAEDDNRTVLRLHEYTGKRGRVEVKSDLNIVNWQECNLMESPTEEKRFSNTLLFQLQPYEIKTFLIETK